MRAFVLDGRRWQGGIGRFARETTPFLPAHATLTSPFRATHPLVPFELAARLRKATAPFFSHGYLPPAHCRVPAIVTLHDLMYLRGHSFQSRPRAAYMSAIKPLLRQCAAIVTMSEAARDQASEWLGHGVRVVAVGGGVSPAFSPATAEQMADRWEHGGRAVVAYVGSTAPNKNIAGVLGGFARARQATTLMVTGCEADWVPHLDQAGHDLDGRIAFLGRVADSELPDVYRRASVLLMPSIEEGFGLPALEAMACGVPVVYGSDAAMREVVGEAGVSVAGDDHCALGAAIDSLISDAQLAGTLAARGLARAAQRTWPQVAARIADVIASCDEVI